VRKGITAAGNRLSHPERLEILERIAGGETQPQIAAALGCTERTVRRVLERAGGTPSRRSRRRARSALRLSLTEREEIRAGIACGDSFRAIARQLGRAPSTVSREVGGTRGRQRYRATKADDRACLRALRPKRSKLASNPRLRRMVCAMLERRFSPRQISARLRLEHPDDPELRIAPETIYQSLYVQSRGRFRKDLTRYLRSGRSKRKPRRGPTGQGRIPDMVSISQRPPEASDRAVPGHWEGDLLVGKANRSFIGTLVERQTRYVLLSRLGSDAGTETVTARIAEQIARLPEQLRLSPTWDQGREMARHREFTVATGVKVYPLRPPLAVAAGHGREHQRAAAPVLPQADRPSRSRPGRTRPRRRRAQRPAPPDTGLADASREDAGAVALTARSRPPKSGQPASRGQTPGCCAAPRGAPGGATLRALEQAGP
jgi:transposase, IS30 family